LNRLTELPSVSVNLRELDSGSWVIFELPGFTTASAGTPQDSLDALRSASATSYYNGNGSLWLKVVSAGGGGRGGRGGGNAIQVSR
jgi:cell migration-inducing and hyaluronan-binding protein